MGDRARNSALANEEIGAVRASLLNGFLGPYRLAETLIERLFSRWGVRPTPRRGERVHPGWLKLLVIVGGSLLLWALIIGGAMAVAGHVHHQRTPPSEHRRP
jgi:hypothetical protein